MIGFHGHSRRQRADLVTRPKSKPVRGRAFLSLTPRRTFHWQSWNFLKSIGGRILHRCRLVRMNRTATLSLSRVRTRVPRHGRLATSADEGMTMATNKKNSTSQPSRGRKSASKSASRSTTKKGTAAPKRAQPKALTGSRSTKSQAVPAKARSSAGSRSAARSTSGASRSRSTTQARSASRSHSQGSLPNPMAWLSSLETTLTSPQARAVMAEALRAVANVLEKPQGGEQGQGAGTQEGREAVSAAGSLGAEIVAAPLEVAAAAIGAAGEVVTGALGGLPREEGGTSNSRKGGRRASSGRKSSTAGT
jgi:hypothetical protein